MSLLLSILFLEDDIFSKVAAAVAASLLYINGIFNAIFSNSRSALLQLSGDPTNQPTTITYKNITTHKQKGSLSQRQERLATWNTKSFSLSRTYFLKAHIYFYIHPLHPSDLIMQIHHFLCLCPTWSTSFWRCVHIYLFVYLVCVHVHVPGTVSFEGFTCTSDNKWAFVVILVMVIKCSK